MRCSSCGTENSNEVKFCMKCGAALGADPQNGQRPKPVRQYVALQAQSSVSKMLETPGTTVLTIGVVMVIVAIVVGAFGHWLAGIALFGISVLLIYFAVQLRGQESRAAAVRATHTEVREREIVKVKCRYCGALNPDGAKNCGSCGALL